MNQPELYKPVTVLGEAVGVIAILALSGALHAQPNLVVPETISSDLVEQAGAVNVAYLGEGEQMLLAGRSSERFVPAKKPISYHRPISHVERMLKLP